MMGLPPELAFGFVKANSLVHNLSIHHHINNDHVTT
jgi:hypothetical protein